MGTDGCGGDRQALGELPDVQAARQAHRDLSLHLGQPEQVLNQRVIGLGDALWVGVDPQSRSAAACSVVAMQRKDLNDVRAPFGKPCARE
jgi:hypothetical protein